MININIEKSHDNHIIDNYEEIIKTSIMETLASEEIDRPDISIEVNVNLINSQQIQAINKKHRGIDKTTDVLSFPLMNDFSLDQLILGDILINTEKIIQQAREYERTMSEELTLMTIHSCLHLLGYDHMDEMEEKIMIEKEEEILSKLKGKI